jgi:integrase
MAYTREGELLALTWNNIDTEQGMVRIAKTLTSSCLLA